ncbi:MAG: tetratricopeptide repeat protein [Planctomycetota bacterium]
MSEPVRLTMEVSQAEVFPGIWLDAAGHLQQFTTTRVAEDGLMYFEDDEYGCWDNAEQKAQTAFELYEAGQLGQALENLEEAIKINPTNSSWHFNKALTLDALDRFDEAIEEYKLALELEGDDLEILNCLAVDYTRTGFYDLSLEIFERIEQLDPSFEPCYCNRIITYTEIEEHDKAEEMFYIAQQINEDCPLCYYNIGNSLFSRGEYKKAIWCWGRTAMLEPNHPQINYRIAQAYWADENIENAREYFLAELRKNPSDVDTTLDYGVFLLEQGEISSAQEKFNRLLEFSPEFAPAFNYLGEIALNCGKYKLAQELYSKAIEKNKDLVGPRYRLAQCALASGDINTAKELLLSEVKLEPASCDALLSMGSMFLKMDEIEAAVHCFLRVIDEDHENVKALYYLGIALAAREQYEDAADFLEHALEAEPDNPAILKTCARVYAQMGRLAEASEKVAAARTAGGIDRDIGVLGASLRIEQCWEKIKEAAALFGLMRK